MDAEASDRAAALSTAAISDTKNTSTDTNAHVKKYGSGTSPTHPQDEQKLQQAEAFLSNSEIENVSASAKREFLQNKVGMSRDEVDAAMKRVARREGVDRLDDRDLNRRGADDLYEVDSRDRRGNRRRYDDDFHEDRFSRGRRGDHRMDRRGSMYETSMPHPQPRYNESNNHMNPYGQGLPPDQIDGRDKSPGFSFTSWAGGFSLGVFCLAALRWLNGGDFVLFPPPSASDSLRAQSRHIQKKSRSDENNAEDSGELEEQEEGLVRLLDDVAENEEEEADDNFHLNDEALNSILNGTVAANNLHPADAQPSYQDLVSEIRTLTSAVHSYREEQERANRAAAVKVGRGVTDDVMNFLKEDKQKGKNIDMSSVVSMLKDVLEDLLRLKQTIPTQSKVTEDGDGTNQVDLKGVVHESTDSSQTDDKLPDGDDMLTFVDSLAEKIQQVITTIELPKQDQSDENEQLSSNEGTTTELAQTAPSDTDVKNETAQKEPSEANNVNNGDVENNNSTVATSESYERDAIVQAETSEKPESNTEDVELSLRILSNGNGEEELKVGAQMLYLYCLNISKNPSVPRYRKIYTNNNSFQMKVGNLKGAKDLLCAVGFVEKKNFFEWDKPFVDTTETQSSLDLAIAALDMMRKGTKHKVKPELDN